MVRVNAVNPAQNAHRCTCKVALVPFCVVRSYLAEEAAQSRVRMRTVTIVSVEPIVPLGREIKVTTNNVRIRVALAAMPDCIAQNKCFSCIEFVSV